MNGYDKATIQRIRAGVQQQVDLLKRWEAESLAAGEYDKAKRHRWASFIIEHKLLGAGEGCVITTLDARWMDDDFRAMMEPVIEAIEDIKSAKADPAL